MKAMIIVVALSMALLLTAVLVWADETDLVWSTFLGGIEYDGGDGDIAVDNAGSVHIIGTTSSANFPTTAGAFDNTLGGGTDAFVTKLSPTGSNLVYSTFLGGMNSDYGYGIAVDSAGNVYVTGATDSYDFPITPEAFDTCLNDTITYPSEDAFVTKLNPSGNDLVYSSYLGGFEDSDWGFSIAVGGSGNAYITGGSWCDDFPVTAGSFDITHNGAYDVIVVKFNLTGSGLDYSTFLGGSSPEQAFSIAVDDSGNAYITGDCQSADFPTTAGAFDSTYNGGISTGGDAFVAKLNPQGADLVYATFLGGASLDNGSCIVLDSAGCAYVVGQTASAGFPVTAGVFDPTHNGDRDAFVAKFNPTGDALEFATFLGGSHFEGGWGIALDNAGNIHVIGQTESADFPTSSGAFDATFNGISDAFVSKLNCTASDLVYSTFLGGAGFDFASWGIAIDGSGQTCLLGGTYSADFPSTGGAFDTTYNGSEDAFVAKLDLSGYPVPVMSDIPTDGMPQIHNLHQNYPNPFNTNTQIFYQIPNNTHVTLKIYNVTGQEIITLVDDDLSAGSYTATWNGRDAHGAEVSAGIYFCTMRAGEFRQTRKMVLLK